MGVSVEAHHLYWVNEVPGFEGIYFASTDNKLFSQFLSKKITH